MVVTTDGSGAGYSLRVAQASGMVAVQACCNIAGAIELMEQLAAETGRTLDGIATAVVEREIRFGDAVP